MAITVEATYEDGVLKPKQPLPLKEHEEVRITIESGLSLAERSAGLIRWTGTHEEMEQLLAELDEPEELP